MVALAGMIAGMFAAVAKYALVKPLENQIDKNGQEHHAEVKADTAAAINQCRDELRTDIHHARDELKAEICGSREEARALVRNHVADMHMNRPPN